MEVLPWGGANPVARAGGHLRLEPERVAAEGAANPAAGQEKRPAAEPLQRPPNRAFARLGAAVSGRRRRLVSCLAQRPALVPGAQAAATGTGQAQPAVRAFADSETVFLRARDPRRQLLLERRSRVGSVARHDPLAALEKPVDD